MSFDPALLVTLVLAALLLITLVVLWMRVGHIARQLPPSFETRLADLTRCVERYDRTLTDAFARSREDGDRAAKLAREEFADFRQTTDTRGDRLREGLAQQLEQLRQLVDGQLTSMRQLVDAQLTAMRQENETRLEAMRQTVDEKLQSTLEERLGASFRLVSERLDLVHRGLGEMQALASGVGDLKRMLTNVKARGTWGEVQLGGLLEQVLTEEQFAQNVAVKPDSNERVDFAVRLPGQQGDGDAGAVWLPIDAKFPVEDYQRLCDAVERADAIAIEENTRALEARFKLSAREISAKYVAPPHTTDFAIMFLPTEGLYAEALRRPGLADALQRECRVLLAGPTTLWALLSSLRMGFRTLAIQERSSEVWKTLGAVKTEFGRFGVVLDAVKKKLDEASNKIDQVARRRRVMERTLRNVELLPAAEAERLLEIEPTLFTLPEDEEEDEGGRGDEGP